MVATETIVPADQVAQGIFNLATQFCLDLPRARRRLGDLKETEFLTLVILQGQGSMIVGDIQRILGVLPAQMSRVIRSLEEREQPLISCQINPRDKRKIDVCLTAEGERALQEHQTLYVGAINKLLTRLSEQDMECLSNVLAKMEEQPQGYQV
jgi:DNA-binding MarR family transcriptional regulator